MKKITFLLIALLIATVGYSQLYLLDEEFTGNLAPNLWAHNSPSGNGTQLWTFGSGVMPGTDVNDFTSNAAIFNDNAAGGGARDIAILYYGGSSDLDVTSYLASGTNLKLEVRVKYALNTFATDNIKDAFEVVVRKANNDWVAVFSTNVQTNATFRTIDLTQALAGISGVDLTDLQIGVRFDDKNSSVGWGAGVDRFILAVRPYNDGFFEATQITNFPYHNTQLTDGTTNNTGFLPTCVAGTGMNDGVWYKFTAPATGEVTVNATAADFDLEVAVYNDATSACITNVDAALSGGLETLTFDAVAGTEYRLNFGHYNATNDVLETGLLTVDVTYTLQPDNDTCVEAEIMTTFPYTNTQNTEASINEDFVTTCNAGMNDGVWYTFTAAGDGEFNIQSLTGGYDHEIGVYTGSCGNFTCVDNADGSSAGQPEYLTIDVTYGTQYWINFGYPSFGTDGPTPGNLTVHMRYIPTDNDTCAQGQEAGASNLTVQTNIANFASSTPHNGTVLGASDSGIAATVCEGDTGTPNDDVWFKFTATTEDVHITVDGGFDSVINLFSGTCGNLSQIGCADNLDNPIVQLDTNGLTIGEDYYIRVFSFFPEIQNQNDSAFDISVWTESSTAGVNEDAIEGLSLYPNPVTDVFHVDAQDEITTLIIYNQLGQVVKKTTPNQTNITMNLSDLTAGLYVIEMRSNDKKSVKKLIKK